MSKEVAVQTTEVTFNGASITATVIEGTPYVAVKPICESIGLNWDSQRQRIQRDEILNQVAVMITATCSGVDGKTYNIEMLALPLKFLNGWMFGVDDKRVAENVRPALLKYKLECYDVLSQHFQQQFTENNLLKAGQTRMSFPELKKDFEQLLEDVLALGYTRTEALQQANLAYLRLTGLDMARLIGFPNFDFNKQSKFVTLPELCGNQGIDYSKNKKWMVAVLQHLGLLTKKNSPIVTTMGMWHSNNYHDPLEDVGWDAVTIEHLESVRSQRSLPYMG